MDCEFHWYPKFYKVVFLFVGLKTLGKEYLLNHLLRMGCTSIYRPLSYPLIPCEKVRKRKRERERERERETACEIRGFLE